MSHDYVVVNMWGDRELRCIYEIKCTKCGKTKVGYHDEIPKAKFK
jgi:hypothetical protein